MNDKNQEEMLVQKANQARERLLLVVDELDRKRHNLAHPIKTVKRKLPPPLSMTVVAAGALIAVGTLGYFAAHRVAKKRPSPVRKAFNELPRWLRGAPPAPSFWHDVGTRTAKALVSYALIESGKFAMRRASAQVQIPQSGF